MDHPLLIQESTEARSTDEVIVQNWGFIRDFQGTGMLQAQKNFLLTQLINAAQ
jgi:hypothetical protein